MMEQATGLSLDNYRNEGWGLSQSAFGALLDVLNEYSRINVLEFGSGISTQFLLDYAQASGKPVAIDSFDNDATFKHPESTLSRLVHCSQRNYQRMFESGNIDWSAFRKRWRKPKTRQKNCFYDIRDYTLKSHYDLAIIDGPHGNGRNFAFLVLRQRIAGGYILIDDFNHYGFLETASRLFELEEIARVESGTDSGSGPDNFVLVKVTGVKERDGAVE